ncbi:hypothetical protein NE236_39985 [Actinoallomurus purpureus]|uniref:hypothetical protein n=1 Tax=Actinoallomurus purpureus TaxID=478114 RepID=UPI002093D557|nr:hypothetical protein [Actinoallomurus purpureus]MCO6011153.1 hypothetical protein [Actinoallomurus purpureus]
MTAYVPPGWPSGVHPPGTERFEDTAVAWLFDLVPPEYRRYGVLRRYPIVLSRMARHHVAADLEAAREGFRTARAELSDVVPAHGLEAVLEIYRREGTRLAAIARAVELVDTGLRGGSFTPKL